MLLKNKIALLSILLFLHPSIWAKELKVIVSIKPIYSIVSSLTKGVTKPDVLIQGKQTPFNFKPTKQQIKQLNNASLVIWVGPELEKTLPSYIKQIPKSVEVIELLSSHNLKILPSRSNPELRDPYFWMDDRNAIILLDELTRLLIKIDPSRSHIYTKNRIEMLELLIKIDKEYEYGYRGLKAGLGVSYYDTLQYFEQAYALKTLDRASGVIGDDVNALNLLKVRKRIANKEAVCLFTDKSMPDNNNIDLLTSGQDINIGKLDVLARDFKASDNLYLQMMQYNTDIIKQCLNANMDEATKARIAAVNQERVGFSGIGQGRFILKDHYNNTFTEQNLRGKYALVFFGYTYCPDVCPTNMLILSQALEKMGNTANKLIPYFVSVDPDRDKPKILKDYVSYFNPSIIGLTGSKAMIKRVANQFKAKYEKGEVDPTDKNFYSMDHTGSMYLIAPDGAFITKFAHGIAPDVLADELSAIINNGR